MDFPEPSFAGMLSGVNNGGSGAREGRGGTSDHNTVASRRQHHILDGTNWCVALPGVSQVDLQNALDWACGLGMADCGAIQAGGACFEPDTLVSHASYAFNSYYQQNGNSDIACNFGGTATLSYGKCSYSTSGSLNSSKSPLSKYKPSFTWWALGAILLLLCLRI
ncbi:Glucan endo-1,3-beta-glucosidase 13 [Vitis vinifera]|uniref:Glucan endo-1,3-beta-glucosidase 13 n=1 Tax=Vitis vinifera TaxID=29760 RepID=A0A438IP71_VITVI|nr:Glucan endo-1,3-beta-glucosidase 13 [Vitis vinifera]